MTRLSSSSDADAGYGLNVRVSDRDYPLNLAVGGPCVAHELVARTPRTISLGTGLSCFKDHSICSSSPYSPCP